MHTRGNSAFVPGPSRRHVAHAHAIPSAAPRALFNVLNRPMPQAPASPTGGRGLGAVKPGRFSGRPGTHSLRSGAQPPPRASPLCSEVPRTGSFQTGLLLRAAVTIGTMRSHNIQSRPPIPRILLATCSGDLTYSPVRPTAACGAADNRTLPQVKEAKHQATELFSPLSAALSRRVGRCNRTTDQLHPTVAGRWPIV
jgi:hypothetical protein